MWTGLTGSHNYKSGVDGTLTLPPSSKLILIVVHATSDGYLSIFGGDSIPIIGGDNVFQYQFNHQLFVSRNNTKFPGTQDLVFTNTDSYFVEYMV